MAKFYKYKSPADVEAAAAEFGVELKLSGDFSPLFAPIEIGERTCGNRLAIQPMEGCDGTPEGLPTELTRRRYERFGAGGAKLVWGEATAIEDAGRMNPRQLLLDDANQSAIGEMLDLCRRSHAEECGTADDFLLGLQLTHSGRYSCRGPRIAVRDRLLDPRTINKRTGEPIPPDYPVLTDGELEGIVERYVEAARRCVAIGCDFVDLKQCHRYLLSELLTARDRPGKYGGPLENRVRLCRDIVREIRAACPGLLVFTRLNVHDGIPFVKDDETGRGVPGPIEPPEVYGFGNAAGDPMREDLAEPIQVAKWMAEDGVSLLNLSCGNPYANPHLVRPAEKAPIDGYDAPEHPLLGVLRHFRVAAAVQAAVPEVPVMGSGYSWLQDFAMHAAAANVAAGDVALVGYGRGSLSHPDFARQLAEQGKLERRQVCRTFSYCTNLMRTKDHPWGQFPTGCPPFDKAAYGELWTEAKGILEGAAG